jgi:CDGSH-type Zn-finger protein
MAQAPVTVQLEAGTYYVCSCSQSKNYPYCDGSHKGSEFVPKPLKLEAPATVEITEGANWAISA